MGLFSSLVSLVRDQYPTVQASGGAFAATPYTAGEVLCELTIPRSGIWQLQFDGWQAGLSQANMQIQQNGVGIFVPTMVLGGITNNQFIQVSVNKNDVIRVILINADPAGYYACDIVALQVA